MSIMGISKVQGSNTVLLNISGSRTDGVDGVPGANIYVENVPVLIVEIYTDATYTYTCLAIPGTALTTAAWQVTRSVTASGSARMADGDGDFDNLATDLATVAALSYS